MQIIQIGKAKFTCFHWSSSRVFFSYLGNLSVRQKFTNINSFGFVDNDSNFDDKRCGCFRGKTGLKSKQGKRMHARIGQTKSRNINKVRKQVKRKLCKKQPKVLSYADIMPL